MKEIFLDVVIPVAPKDKDKVLISPSSFLSNSTTHVYLICSSHQIDVSNLKYVKIILEEQFPFALNDLEHILKAKGSIYPHVSWYYQQLLKLCVFEVIEGLGDNVLILDSDFAFMRPLPFLTVDGRALLARGYPFRWTFGEAIKVNRTTLTSTLARNWYLAGIWVIPLRKSIITFCSKNR